MSSRLVPEYNAPGPVAMCAARSKTKHSPLPLPETARGVALPTACLCIHSHHAPLLFFYVFIPVILIPLLTRTHRKSTLPVTRTWHGRVAREKKLHGRKGPLRFGVTYSTSRTCRATRSISYIPSRIWEFYPIPPDCLRLMTPFKQPASCASASPPGPWYLRLRGVRQLATPSLTICCNVTTCCVLATGRGPACECSERPRSNSPAPARPLLRESGTDTASLLLGERKP